MKKVIFDGDGGGDEMQLAAVLLAAANVEVLGATTTFGNTSLNQVLKNTRDILHLLKADHIPYFAGAACPTGAELLEGDGAHGDNGIGGVMLEPGDREQENQLAVDFILDTLRNNPRGTITITATGPLTNIAQAITKDPVAMQRVKQIVIMGGCTQAMQAADIPLRQGNITPYAEFNFYMAAEDARKVLDSDLPITLFPMNTTQGLSVTPKRQNAIRLALLDCGDTAEKVIGMMCAPAKLDRMKFDADPFMHDVHTALFVIKPELYSRNYGRVKVITDPGTLQGMSVLIPSQNNSSKAIAIANSEFNADTLFSIVLNSLKSRLAQPRPAPEYELTHKPG